MGVSCLASSPPLRVRWNLEWQHLGQGATVEGGGDLAGDAVGGGSERIVRHVGVARGRDRVFVAEQRPEDRQAHAGGGADARVRMPNVMEPELGQLGAAADALPDVVEADEVAAGA